MERVKITKVYRGDVDTQYGKKQKVGIKTEQHGEKWLSCFVNKTNENMLSKIQDNEEREIIITQNGDFLNFRLPTGFDYLRQDVDMIKAHLGLDKENGADTTSVPTAQTTSNSNDVDDEDIPF